MSPDGTVGGTNDLYVGSTKLVDNVTAVGLTSDGSRAIYTNMVTDGEGVATVDTSTHAVKQVSVDKDGCVRPEAVCPLCFYACVVTPHATVDGSKILYAVRRNQPFYVVNADGTGLVHLATYSGTLAPAPQRVIRANGTDGVHVVRSLRPHIRGCPDRCLPDGSGRKQSSERHQIRQ